MENISTVTKMIFGKIKGFENLSVQNKKEFGYPLNKRLAKFFPIQASNISTFDPEHYLDVWYSMLNKIGNVPENFWAKDDSEIRLTYKEKYNLYKEEESLFSKETIVKKKN